MRVIIGGVTKHNVAAPLTGLVGRARELDAVGETLRRTRLVTVTGSGGAGKTRLAVELARRQIGRRRDGVWFADLTAAGAGSDPAAEVARTLDVGARSSTSATVSLRRYLADRDVLLVLDNCEHVIDACAALAAAVLGACDGVRILATSREPLAVAGETVWRLDPLDADDARRLFMERARQRRPQFIPSAEADAAIAALCARLDHLPLAIELAAGRMGVMSPSEILADVEARLDALGGGSRLSPPRHRTVRAAVEWSYELLDPTERRAFRSLAVFVGGFDAAAATSVAPDLTLDVLARLVDKSIVSVVESPGGATRYRLLETVREFARELLAQAGELEPARERHLHHFSVPDDVSLDGWPSTRAEAIVDELERDYGNVRAALEWAAASHPAAGTRLLVARRDLFLMLGQADGRRLALTLLERYPARDSHRVELLITAGLHAMFVGDALGAASDHDAARELAAAIGEPRLEGWACFFRGLAEMLGGSPLEARARFEASRAIHHRLGIRIGEGVAMAALGLTHVMADERARGEELLEQALALQVEAAYRWGQGQAHLYLGLAADSAGDEAGASAHYGSAVECLRPYRDSPLLPQALIGLASSLRRRDAARAMRITAAAWTIRSRTGGEFAPFLREHAVKVRAACAAALGTEAERIWTEGTRMGVDDAVALAFGASERRPAAPPGGLSARELEVVRLVASGDSNKAIAADLHLSVRTVESHVRHVLAKVGLENRTQLAAWAHAHDQERLVR